MARLGNLILCARLILGVSDEFSLKAAVIQVNEWVYKRCDNNEIKTVMIKVQKGRYVRNLEKYS